MTAGPRFELRETPPGAADRLWAAAEHRYLHDPLFAAKAKAAVAWVARAADAGGGRLSRDEAEIATRAAVLALHMADACIVMDGALVVLGA